HLAVMRLNSAGEEISQQVLERLVVDSAVSDRARITVGENQLLISYGPQIHLHQLGGEMSFVQVFDQIGYGAGQNALSSNVTVEFTPQGKMVWADTAQGRLQVFKPTLVDINAKAIIVSGGGDYLGNNLWVGTLQNAHQAYRALRGQGFAKDRIYYLSNDTVDFDGNGQDDELFAVASRANLKMALEWANDADSLMLYMVDHGNVDTFRIQPTEIISASEVAGYLDGYTGNLSVVYDACKSGSFVDELQGDNRTIITSSNATRDALFLQRGAISFSGLFWQYIDNGQDMYTAYTQSEAFFDRNNFKQDPQLSVNGVYDLMQLKGRYIGQGYKHTGATIKIDSASAVIVDDQIEFSASVSGDTKAIQRVWVIMMPTDGAVTDSITSPIVDVPSVDLAIGDDGLYHGQISA
ncbi:MAG: C13 family peptidase, partial [Psychrosphaera sp.]|nr:C13 family peptidase [Psychrosphaera sp.]